MASITKADALARLDAHNREQAARIARETDVEAESELAPGATSGGDFARLRGVPVLARGVSGALRGSVPGRGGLFR